MASASRDIPDTLKAPLDDIEPKKRKIPPAGRTIALDDTEGAKLAEKLKTFYSQSRSDRAEMEGDEHHDHTGQTENRIHSYEREYRAGERPAAKKWPLQDANENPRSANFKIPVLFTVGSAEVAQLASASFNTKPFMLVDPQDEADEDRARALEAWYADAYEARMRYPAEYERMLTRQVFEGVGILHHPYREDREWRVTRPQQRPTTGPDGTPAVDEMGQPVFETVQEMGWEVAGEGPGCEVVRRDRFYLYPSSAQYINGPNRAWGVFYAYELSRNDLISGKRDGVWDISDAAWSKLAAPPERTDQSGKAEDEADDIARREAVSYTAVDCYCGYDVEGEGVEVPCLFTFLVETGDLVRARMAPLGGVRPFSQHYSRDPAGTFEGISTAHLLEGLCVAINQFINSAADRATQSMLAANTPFTNTANGLDPDDLYWGAPVNVSGGKDSIWWAPFPPDMESLPMAEFFWSWVERITGITANSLGVPTPDKKTATEIATVSSSGSRLFDHRVRLLDDGHRQGAEITAWQMFLQGPDHLTFRARLNDQQLREAQGMAEQTQRAEQAVYETQMMAYQQAFGMWSQLATIPPGLMPPVGPPPDPPEPPKATPLQTYAPTELTAEDFDPRKLRFNPNGSAGAMNREQKAMEAQMLYTTMQGNPFVMADASRLHKLTTVYLNSFQTLPFNSPEEVLGPEPPPGMPVAMMTMLPGMPMGPGGPPNGQDEAPEGKEGKPEKKDEGPPNGGGPMNAPMNAPMPMGGGMPV